ncbi:hypothetical protein [Paenibacillus glycanilyticus]|uniref:Uncharacterized protein n=1 Tax=Paenibacillus glycanilyticus TaxID=126569 RepID=A0ABQ6GAV9_9BACL|nr:hypothetical protein [Paenibacillus glycanilyticus]GLX66393.1 hypothetical protein MU1_07370 [Paenibacillus glycanilyticus]
MYKLMLIVLMMTVWVSVHFLQTDEEMAMKLLYQSKHALNRAAHAASQQLDPIAMADGVLRIDPAAAEAAAAAYLQANLQLDADGNPLPNSPVRERVTVLAFEVINNDRSFPYTYRNPQYEYEATLERPGVVLIIHVVYPRAFTLLGPIEWDIKGISELTVR